LANNETADTSEQSVRAGSTNEGLPISPSIGPTLADANFPAQANPLDARVLFISGVCVAIGLAAGLLSQVLIHTIWLITNLSFYGRVSIQHVTPPATAGSNPLGFWIIFIPVIGAMIIGLIARYGSRQVAGHGIPEAMEQVLLNQSRIPPKMTFLKPLSAAISIGTGGPFGAEGPIIATGGALGSLVGQLLHTTPSERKVLLAAGASAGIAAAFGCPVAAVLLAIELLLFEFSPRSIIPVALACAMASVVHYHFEGFEPFFTIAGGPLLPPGFGQLLLWTLLGALMGVAAVLLTESVYLIEHIFERIPTHWMWHPALGGLVVGLIGWFAPYTLGSGYFNIDHLLSGNLALRAAVLLLVLKSLSWTISLGSGTAGGTLAPVFTIGGSLGAVLALLSSHCFPSLAIDIRIAALVGMVAIFAGVSRALLTCVVFAFETTLQPAGILPALCGCATAYLVSALLSRTSIMSEKMHRQGVRVPSEYHADLLAQVLVREACSANPVVLSAERSVADAVAWLHSGNDAAVHQGFPLVDAGGNLVGFVTRRDMLDPQAAGSSPLRGLMKRPPVLIYDDSTLREAIDHMLRHKISRLPVITRSDRRLGGVITRGDILEFYGRRMSEDRVADRTLRLTPLRK
jgi:CIC family chloride channel protein